MQPERAAENSKRLRRDTSTVTSLDAAPASVEALPPSAVNGHKRSPSARVTRRRVIRRSILPDGLRSAVATSRSAAGHEDALDRERSMLADYLKMLSWWLGRPPLPSMPRRLEQTLMALLRGRSEKQIALDLGVSIHTVHDYIKNLHKRFNVASRGELLTRFLPFKGKDRPSTDAMP